MSHEARNLRQEIRDRCGEGSRRGQKVLIPAEIAHHINHAHLADAPAVELPGGGGGSRRLVVVVVAAIPYAEEGVVGGLEGSQGVGDGGGDGKGPQRRLAKAEVGYLMCQQAHCHAKNAVREREEEREELDRENIVL